MHSVLIPGEHTTFSADVVHHHRTGERTLPSADSIARDHNNNATTPTVMPPSLTSTSSSSDLKFNGDDTHAKGLRRQGSGHTASSTDSEPLFEAYQMMDGSRARLRIAAVRASEPDARNHHPPQPPPQPPGRGDKLNVRSSPRSPPHKIDTSDALLSELAAVDVASLEPAAAVRLFATFARRAVRLCQSAATDQALNGAKQALNKSSRQSEDKKKVAGPSKRRRSSCSRGLSAAARARDGDTDAQSQGTTCDRCGKTLATAIALSGHKRFCDGGAWRCDWCKCRADECSGKNPGPRGPATLCGACGSRYRAGHSGPVLPNERGKYECEACGRELDSIGALGGHRRFCDGGAWRCDWCKCTAAQCSGKNPGPRGPATLCGACGSRYRAGHTGPPRTTLDGKFVCETCGKLLDSIGALGGHRRFCDGGQWRCAWCKCTAAQCSGKNPGPDGPATLCGACGSRYRAGHSGPPRQDEAGKYVCEACGKLLESIVALGGHRRFCDGGQWRCSWCQCKADATSSKTAGPDGPGTLCGSCGSRYRSGHDGPALPNLDGKYACEACGKLLDSIIALSGHRRFCDGRLAALVYDDGAEWLGGRRGDALPWPVAADSKATTLSSPDAVADDELANTTDNEQPVAALQVPLALPSEPRFLLAGRDAGPVLEAWDLARHLARRLGDVARDCDDLDAAAAAPGRWWEDVAPGCAQPLRDGWSWEVYENAIVCADATKAHASFHVLQAALARTLVRSDGTSADTEAVARLSYRRKSNVVHRDNWLTELAAAFPEHAVARLATLALQRLGIDDEEHVASGTLFSALQVGERLELVLELTRLAMSSSVIRDHVATVALKLDRLAALKREEWARRKALTEAAADLLGAEPPRIVYPNLPPDAQNQAKLRAIRVVSDAFSSAPVRREKSKAEGANNMNNSSASKKRQRDGDEQPSASAAKMNRAKWLRQAHEQQRRELDAKFEALRAKVGSYRRLSLGADRDGRDYFLLGDVWDRVFVSRRDDAAAKPTTWFAISAQDATKLRASLCPKLETKLARTFDRVLPNLQQAGLALNLPDFTSS